MEKWLRHLLFGAFIIRIVALLVIVSTGDTISTGLLGSTSIQDDVRYIETGQLYAERARSIIDVPTFQQTMDTVEYGYIHDSFTSLWDWMMCVLYYILRSKFLLKIINIFFAIATIKCIYDICNSLYGERCARIASRLYAFLPYPIIFSCFMYKDQFYTLISLLLLREALRCAGNIKLKNLITMLLLVIASLLTRSGLVVLVVFALFVILYKRGGYHINYKILFVAIPLVVLLGYYVVLWSWEPIQTKLLSYVIEYTKESDSGFLDYFLIKTPSDIYKFPLSLFVILLLPLNLSFSISNWMDVAGILNLVSIPIAIGNILYLINFRIKKTYFYWLALLFYAITVVTSLGIVRHQFFLQPYMMMIFAVYLCSTKRRAVLCVSSLCLIAFVVSMWII